MAIKGTGRGAASKASRVLSSHTASKNCQKGARERLIAKKITQAKDIYKGGESSFASHAQFASKHRGEIGSRQCFVTNTTQTK